ncbi:MAG: hypothetical protein K1060chlam2_00899 [Chlamydiae bacterium]|nr:hypothetical protein [Chlamydiota bacterium]
MKKTLRFSFFIALGVLLAGCVTSTSYHALDSSGEGFADHRLGDDCFTVSFSGNGQMAPDALLRSALRRASEVATNHGYRYFTVFSERDQNSALELSFRCYNEKPIEDAIDAYRFLTYFSS